MSSGSQYVIRRTDRHEVVLPARIRVHPSNSGQVRLAARSGHTDGWVTADLIDIAQGGAGLVAMHYFPRDCHVEIELYDPADQSAGPTLNIDARIRRVSMIDRRPSYMIGLLFNPEDQQAAEQLAHLLDRVVGSNTTTNEERDVRHS